MGFFDKHKALIITVLLCSLLLLIMYNIKLSGEREEFEQMLVDLEEFQQEETEEEVEEPEAEEEPQEQPEPPQKNLQTHQAYNQNQQEREKTFESRLDEIFEKNSADQEASEEENTNISAGEVSVNTRKERRQRASEGNNSSEETSTRSGNTGNSSIAFSLVGRSAYNIPNPIYTCERSGKIVVNIVVNEEGSVTNTSINKGSSTSTNDCLVDNALEYAASATFSRLNGRNEQKGTITYYFQGQ